MVFESQIRILENEGKMEIRIQIWFASDSNTF